MHTPAMVSKAMLAASLLMGTSMAATPVRRQADTIEVHRPSTQPLPEAPMSQGCFSSGGNMTTVKPDDLMSSGSCNEKCKTEGYWVSGLHGPECQCGFSYPPKNSRAKDGLCENLGCLGYPQEPCGSLDPDAWLVWNLGVELVHVEYYEPDETTSSASPSKTAAQSSGDAPTNSPTDAGNSDESNDDDSGSETNVAAIAAGVSVGVVVILAAIGGGFWFMRRRRNAEIEEDHRRNAAVNAFISGAKPPSSHGSISMSDTRLDPTFNQRRMSDGSIADNQDYSRKILRVTNA